MGNNNVKGMQEMESEKNVNVNSGANDVRENVDHPIEVKELSSNGFNLSTDAKLLGTIKESSSLSSDSVGSDSNTSVVEGESFSRDMDNDDSFEQVREMIDSDPFLKESVNNFLNDYDSKAKHEQQVELSDNVVSTTNREGSTIITENRAGSIDSVCDTEMADDDDDQEAK